MSGPFMRAATLTCSAGSIGELRASVCFFVVCVLKLISQLMDAERERLVKVSTRSKRAINEEETENRVAINCY